MTAGAYLQMMQDRRRANLARMAAKETSQAAFADKVDFSREHMNTLIRGKRAFTEYTARRIEQVLGLGFGTLDLELS